MPEGAFRPASTWRSVSDEGCDPARSSYRMSIRFDACHVCPGGACSRMHYDIDGVTGPFLASE
jgi:hypothetical protein